MNQPHSDKVDAATAADQQSFQNTVVAATIDAPIEPGKNVVWCASFQAAWKRLQHDLVKEPVRLDGAEALVEALNEAPDPAEDIPEEWLYAAAGLTEDGIVERIVREMAERFPEKEEPDIHWAVGFLAYAYLTASLTFPDPYLQNDEPLLFNDSSGRQTPMSSFGLREKDKEAFHKVRMQPRLLYAEQGEQGELEFAFDLYWRSESVQLVVACVEPGETLSATVARVLPWSRKIRYGIVSDKVVMLVPDMDWHLEHDYGELCGRAFANPGIELPSIDVARQDIAFKLSRSGAQLSSEAKMGHLGVSLPEYYIFDRPFLLYMKLRQSERPFLAMWVDNAELLKPFSAEEALAAHRLPKEALSQFQSQLQGIISYVDEVIGQDVGSELQSTEAYQAYVGLCGEAWQAYENEQVHRDTINDLEDHVGQVIRLHYELQKDTPRSAPVAAPKVESQGSILVRLLDRLRGR